MDSDSLVLPYNNSADTTVNIDDRMPHEFVTVACCKCGDVKTIMVNCGDRTCPRCNGKRRALIMGKYEPVIKKMRNPMFLTLTTKSRLITGTHVKWLRDCFTKLRHRTVWKSTGGIYQIEVGNIKNGVVGNLHIHAIIDGEYMKQSDLSREWHDITGDSYIVDIRACKGVRMALRYMTKHMGKMITNPTHRDLINHVFKGSRLVQGFGVFIHESLGHRDTVCDSCGGLNSYVACYDPLYFDCVGVF